MRNSIFCGFNKTRSKTQFAIRTELIRKDNGVISNDSIGYFAFLFTRAQITLIKDALYYITLKHTIIYIFNYTIFVYLSHQITTHWIAWECSCANVPKIINPFKEEWHLNVMQRTTHRIARLERYSKAKKFFEKRKQKRTASI